MAARTKTKAKTNGVVSNGARVKGGAEIELASTWQPGSLHVRKAYKMYVGGAFIRSESGRYFQVPETRSPGSKKSHVAKGSTEVENIPLGSRKDARDAVKIAHGAQEGWAKRTATNRGQILYRLAEMLDARHGELEASLERAGRTALDARREVLATIDRVMAFAGWTDKYQSLFSSLNPVAGPHFDFTIAEPMGVVVVVAPQTPALLGLVSAVLPIIASGNTVVVLASEDDPRTAITFSEAIATSDLPGGVINILTGRVKEMLPHLARHMDVAALDLHGVDSELSRQAEELGSDTVKRVRVRNLGGSAWYDDEACSAPRWIERFVEMKTIWHPSGS